MSCALPGFYPVRVKGLGAETNGIYGLFEFVLESIPEQNSSAQAQWEDLVQGPVSVGGKSGRGATKKAFDKHNHTAVEIYAVFDNHQVSCCCVLAAPVDPLLCVYT